MARRAAARFAPEDIARLRLPSEPSLSPDGKRVVYVETTADLKHDRNLANLVCIDVESGRSTRLAPGLHADRSPSWTPDSKSIVFASDRGDRSGLWRFDLGGREPVLLAAVDGHVTSPRVSPDGRRVAFVLRRGRSPRHVWILELASRRLRQLTSGELDDGSFDWSPDGRALVFAATRTSRTDTDRGASDLYVVAVRGGRARRLTREPGRRSAPSWSPDGRRIAWVGHEEGADPAENAHVWVIPARGGPARDLVRDDLHCDARLVSDSVEPHDAGAPRLVWSADSRRIAFLATRDGATNVWEVPAGGGAVRQLSTGAHDIRALQRSGDGRRWVFVRATATSPGEITIADWPARAPKSAHGGVIPGARVRALTRLGGTIATRAIAPEELRIPCAGGYEIQGWVLRSPALRGKRGPTVLLLPAEPQTAYGATWLFESQLLASRGVHVIAANLRGSAGYGRDFMRALVGRWGNVDHDDLMRVADAIEVLPFVDRQRIAVAGTAYGGYLAAWAVSHTRRFAGAIVMRGAYDLVSLHGSGDLGWDLAREFEGQRPWESIDRWWRVSPLAHVAAIRTPLLILHPDADERFPVSQAEELYTALRILERDVELVRFAGEGQDFSRSGRPRQRVERLRRMTEWLDRKL